MKARIFRLDSDGHRHAERLLPWYANNTLDANERAQVEEHLASCPRCRADAEFQARLRAAGDDMAPAEAADAARGWAVLHERLAGSALASERRRPVRRRWRVGWPIALMIQAVLVLGLAGVLLIGLSPRPDRYEALGSAPSAPAANALVVFRPEATEAQIRAALRASDSRLVGGPTVTDAYLVRMPGNGGSALQRLRAQPAVLRVESLVGEAPP